MKNFKFLTAFVAFATLLGLTSCSDDPTELLNGGQGPAGSITLNVNYTVPGQETKVFYSTYVTAEASGTTITINAENEDTGESLVISFVGNRVQKETHASYVATVTYIDANGNEYSALSPFTSQETGAVRLSDINTTDKTITGVFSLIGYDANADEVTDGVPFFSGTFMNVPYTGVLPEPTFIKATIDSTFVDFETVSTTTTLDTITTYRGSNATPKYSLEMKFLDNKEIVTGATINLGATLQVEAMIDETKYIAKTGSVKITTVTETVATGTFLFSAATEDNTDTIQITGGEFKVLLE